MFQAQLVEQLLEAVAVFRKVDGIRGGAEDRHIGGFKRMGELQRRLPAELHDHAMQRAILPLGIDDFEHILRRQRLEIEPVGGVVIGRHRLGIAVDHDGFIARFRQREAGMAAAIIELDALADAVRPAAKDDDLFLSDGRASSAGRPAKGVS